MMLSEMNDVVNMYKTWLYTRLVYFSMVCNVTLQISCLDSDGLLGAAIASGCSLEAMAFQRCSCQAAS